MPELIQSLFSNVWSFALIILFFGGSIFVHELGHFLAAKRRGLKIDRFSIGFGPRIFGWTRDGVEYRVSWIPLGGYVALPQLADMRGIEGDPSEETERLPPISYSSKVIVAVMGALFNVLFSFALACLLWVMKQPVSASQTSTTIGYIADTVEVENPDGTRQRVPSAAVAAGLQVGDVIRTIDGRSMKDWGSVFHAVMTGGGRADDGRPEAVFEIERGGELRTIVLHPELSAADSKRKVGIDSGFEVIVAAVPEHSLAATAGLRAGDRLVSIDGTRILNHQTYSSILTAKADQPLPLVVKRGDAEVALVVPPRLAPLIEGVLAKSIAHAAGLKAGDRVTAFDGTPPAGVTDLIERLNAGRASPHRLTVARAGTTIEIDIPARATPGALGIRLSHGLGETLTADVQMVRVDPLTQCWDVVVETYYTLRSLLDPGSNVSISDMSGPLGIGNVYYHAAREGIRFVIWITILVNINLAIFNLLPIPVLDGGHILFATIAKLRGRAIPPNVLVTTQSVFMVLLLSMVLYVTVFDAKRIWSDGPAESAPAAPAQPKETVPAPAAGAEKQAAPAAP
ncbi:MAG: site-2 protease family protein [Opitutaceae bacterium]|nr:site-2 protease family protein [Opitutaceae bacterium]